MSTEGRAAGPPCRSLADYVRGLLTALDASDPSAGWRLRQLVDGRSAVLVLDDEQVRVHTTPDGDVVVDDDPAGPAADGVGITDRRTVLDLLDGTLEVSAAVLDGRLQARGAPRDVAAIFTAIEIILDASTRSPQLQHLAADYRADPCRPSHAPMVGGGGSGSWLALPDGERRLLAALDLLPAPEVPGAS